MQITAPPATHICTHACIPHIHTNPLPHSHTFPAPLLTRLLLTAAATAAAAAAAAAAAVQRPAGHSWAWPAPHPAMRPARPACEPWRSMLSSPRRPRRPHHGRVYGRLAAYPAACPAFLYGVLLLLSHLMLHASGGATAQPPVRLQWVSIAVGRGLRLRPSPAPSSFMHSYGVDVLRWVPSVR